MRTKYKIKRFSKNPVSVEAARRFLNRAVKRGESTGSSIGALLSGAGGVAAGVSSGEPAAGMAVTALTAQPGVGLGRSIGKAVADTRARRMISKHGLKTVLGGYKPVL